MAANNHKERFLETLQALRKYALTKTTGEKFGIGLTFHEEDSYLMRFANSAISLNTNEHLIRLNISVTQDRQQAGYELITDLSKLDEMKQGVDIAVELVQHAQPLNYQPTIPVYPASFSDESSYDAALAEISNADRLAFFNQVVAGMETDEIKASGIFSNGSTTIAMVHTSTEYTQYFRFSDAQVIAVLAHSGLKWEVTAEGSAQCKADLDAAKLNHELATMITQYQTIPPQQLPLGKYDIVFGPAAIGEMVSVLRWIGFNGGAMKRGFSFLNETQVGQKVFSEHFTLTDDPSRRETYPFRRDYYGLPRDGFPIFKQGVFQGFTWMQDDADEFNVQPTGHTVSHTSLTVDAGEQDVATIQDLIAMPRERDLLYVPFLHYMNFVNPSKGIITASSRFGALLLKQDGTIGVPYNVRLTQSLLDVFGDKVAWLSRHRLAYNVSASYGRRNPTAVIIPAFMRVNDLEISHSNTSY